jgi:hypothetical protein
MAEEMPSVLGANLLLGRGRQWPAVVGDGLTSYEIRGGALFSGPPSLFSAPPSIVGYRTNV